MSVDDTIEINGITYKIEKYEHTTEFGNRNKDTVLDYLKDLYGEAIDDNYNLSNGNSYIFITLTIEMISRLKVIEMWVFCMPSRMIWREYRKTQIVYI